MKNKVIEILENIANLLQIKGEPFFKFSSYSKAADLFRNTDYDIEQLVKDGELIKIDGIGKALNEKISDLVLNGEMKYYKKLTTEIPESLLELLKIDGLGPKKVYQLYTEAGINNIYELKVNCLNGKIALLKGFTATSTEKILKSIEELDSLSNYKERRIDFEKIL